MRHIFTLMLACFSLLSYAISPNKQYYIFHASGMVLSAIDGRPNLHTFDATSGQVFQFSSTGNAYYIKSIAKNSNISKTGTWDTELSSSTGNVAKFYIEECGGDYIGIVI